MAPSTRSSLSKSKPKPKPQSPTRPQPHPKKRKPTKSAAKSKPSPVQTHPRSALKQTPTATFTSISPPPLSAPLGSATTYSPRYQTIRIGKQVGFFIPTATPPTPTTTSTASSPTQILDLKTARIRHKAKGYLRELEALGKRLAEDEDRAFFTVFCCLKKGKDMLLDMSLNPMDYEG